MTTQEFLDRYDSSKHFTEDELYKLWIDDTEDYFEEVRDVEYGEPHRWNISADRVIKVGDRYFMLFCFMAATEYQQSCYDQQPEEVQLVEKVIQVWETIN